MLPTIKKKTHTEGRNQVMFLLGSYKPSQCTAHPSMIYQAEKTVRVFFHDLWGILSWFTCKNKQCTQNMQIQI